MKDIKEYRSRFYNLLESTIGDVKPLISEQGEYPKPTPTPNPAFSNNPNPNSGNNNVSSGVGQGGNNSVQGGNNSVQGTPASEPTQGGNNVDATNTDTGQIVTNNTNGLNGQSNNPDITKSGDGYLGTALSVHKVAAGENLTNIAKTYGVTVDQILKSNPQIKNKNMIKAGEIINIER
jgi:LysM repeat protein